MKNFSDSLSSELESQLAAIHAQSSDPLVYSEQAINTLVGKMEKLKSFFLEYSFAGKSEGSLRLILCYAAYKRGLHGFAAVIVPAKNSPPITTPGCSRWMRFTTCLSWAARTIKPDSYPKVARMPMRDMTRWKAGCGTIFLPPETLFSAGRAR